jgi:hypothetical protein
MASPKVVGSNMAGNPSVAVFVVLKIWESAGRYATSNAQYMRRKNTQRNSDEMDAFV